MLQLQDLRVDQVKESCIGLTQENLMEFLVQSIYIYLIYYTRWSMLLLCLAYPKDHV